MDPLQTWLLSGGKCPWKLALLFFGLGWVAKAVREWFRK